MADLSDVEKAIARQVRRAFFPGLTVNPKVLTNSPVVNVAGQPVKLRVIRGWPVDGALDADMAAGGCVISIYPEPGMTRNTNRFRPQALRPISKVDVTLDADVDGRDVTITGEATKGQYVGVGVGQTGYTHICQDSDTPATIAAGLAAQIDGATADGAVLTVPGDGKLVAICDSEVTLTRRLGTQVQAFNVAIWASSDLIRDAVGRALVPALTVVRTLVLPDGTKTTPPRIVNTWSDDFTQKAKVWARRHRVELEYATTETIVAPPLLHPGLNTDETQVGRFPPEDQD